MLGWAATQAHVVEDGETFSSIAVLYGTTSEAIIGLSGISDPAHFFIGDILQVPVCYAAPVLLPAVDPLAALHGWSRIAEYTIRPGDSFASVAREFFTTPDAIALFNELPVDVPPEIGTTLRVPWGFALAVEALPSS